jgi:hypothetical protein
MPDLIHPELDHVIQRLYEVFRPYSAPTHPMYCEHCVTEPEDVVLRTKPLRDLSASELQRYSFKAISTWGTVEQFKHLLPRMFELVIEEEYAYNPEILFKKPRYGGLTDWPEREKTALFSFCDAMWRVALQEYPLSEHFRSFPSIDECLCSVGQIIDDLEPMLKAWELETTNNTLHLADFAAENSSTLYESQTLSNAFWKERPEQMKQVVDWFLSQDFARVLDLIELGTMPYDVREELVRAVRTRSSSE